MNRKILSIFEKARRLAMNAALVVVPLVFWLGAHEVFEKPKTIALLLYSCFLLPVSLPLIFDRNRWTPAVKTASLFGLVLLLAATLSHFNGNRLLPHNQLLGFEMLAPLWASALIGLVFMLEDAGARRKALFNLLVAHLLLAGYGVIQVADQLVGKPLHVRFDIIQWVSFGVTRIYSTMGNPDYMSAQFSLFIPVLIGLGWRYREPWLKAAFQVTGLTFIVVPPILLIATGLQKAMPIWLTWVVFGVLLILAGRRLSQKALALIVLYVVSALVLAAQGRAAILGYATALGLMLVLLVKTEGRAYLAARMRFIKIQAVLAAALFGVFILGPLALRAVNKDLSILKAPPVAMALNLSDSVLERAANVGDFHNDSWVVRLFYWRSALNMGLDHPWLGVGIGNHAMFTAAQQAVIWKQWQAAGDRRTSVVEPHVELYTHNDFIQNFAEMGFAGLAAFLALWAWFIRNAYVLTRHEAESKRRLGIGLLGFAAAFAVSALLNFPWRVVASLQFCWLVFALLASQLPGGRSRHSQTPAWMPAAALVLLVALMPLAALFVHWFPASVLIKTGNFYRDRSNAAPAVAFYEKAYEVGLSGTQRVEHHLYVGSMYNVLNRHDKALEWFERGLKVFPGFLEAQHNIGFTYMTLREKSADPAEQEKYWKLAVEAFEKTLEVNPRYSNALNHLGNLYYAKRDYAKAQSYYETLIRYQPNQWQTLYNLGAVYALRGDYSKARKSLGKSVEINPSFEQAKQLLQQLQAIPDGAQVQFK